MSCRIADASDKGRADTARKRFWSLTLYNKEHLFEPNKPLLSRNEEQVHEVEPRWLADHLRQNVSPGADKQDNWLPAPRDNFSLYIRAYWPKEEITSGYWVPPLVKAAL